MAGTIVADTIQADSTSTLVLKNGVANTPPTIQDSAGTQIGTFCRAWVNFNGTGTIAIRASFNVRDITDNGTGDYTVNFTNAFADANYSVINQFEGSNPAFGASGRVSTILSLATGSSRVRVGFLSSTAIFQAEDVPTVCASVFR